ncbi:hypothetical protein B998_02404 [Brucella sp. F96/2]|nr:hypothetical protein C983_02266 [Brucella sp. F23/97]ENT15000.1 hypothetical protein B998_02404 [Brucella sp. F96/2]ENT19399.1 hypothetical protein C065_02634 [Brucella sp. UK1/97]
MEERATGVMTGRSEHALNSQTGTRWDGCSCSLSGIKSVGSNKTGNAGVAGHA